MNDQDIEKNDIDMRNLLNRAWNSQRIQIINKKNRWINKISMIKYRNDNYINKNINFTFRNIFKLNIIIRKNIYLMIKDCKIMNFLVIYDL